MIHVQGKQQKPLLKRKFQTMAWDLSFKNILRSKLAEKGTNVDIGVELAVSNQQIDFLIKDNSKKQPPFHNARQFIVGEFKSSRDNITTGNFYDLIGKFFTYIATTHGYGRKAKSTEKLNHQEGTCIIIWGGTRQIPKFVMKTFHMKKIEHGIFESRNNDLPHFLALHADQLAEHEDLYWIGLFGSEKTVEKTFERSLQKDDTFIKSIGYFLYGDKLLTIANKLDKPIDPTSLNIKLATETIGIKRVIEEVGLKRVIEEVELKRVIEEVGLKRVIEEVGLKQAIEEIGWDNLLILLENEQPEVKEKVLINILQSSSEMLSHNVKKIILATILPKLSENEIEKLLQE